MRICAVVVVAAACSFRHGELPSRDAPQADVMIVDMPTDVLIPDMPANTCTPSGLNCFNGGFASAQICNGACWVRCEAVLAINQNAASTACTGWGGKLAPIRDAGDQACVEQTLLAAQVSWIGFEQADNSSTVASGWSWNGDLQAVTYTHWDPAGQPDDQNGNENGQEQCAVMDMQGFWQDVPCNGVLPRFSCRR